MTAAEDGAGSTDGTRRRSLQAWRRALGRESHHLVTKPVLLGPLLHNRLQWEPDEIVGEALAHRPRRGAWLRSRTPPQESEGHVRTLVGHTAMVLGCAVAPDGSSVVSVGWDGTVRIWDVVSGRQTASLVGHGRVSGNPKFGPVSLQATPVNGCAVSPDGTWVVSASDDGTLRIWDVAASVERARLDGHDGFNACAVSPDGTWIAAAGADGSVQIWDVATASKRATLEGHTDAVIDCAISPDGTWIASVSDDESLRLWDVATASERLSPVEGLRDVAGCAISPDGSWIATSGFSKRYGVAPPPWPCLRTWDPTTGAEIAALKGDATQVYGCAISPDGASIAAADYSGAVELWDVASTRSLGRAVGHTGGVEAVAFSPDGTRLVSASADETLRVWDVVALTTGAGGLEASLGNLEACAMAPDGTWVAAVGDHAGVWDTGTCSETATMAGDLQAMNACAVAPDGSYVVTASSFFTRVLLWDPHTGAILGRLEGNESANDCAVAPDGSYVLTASHYGALRVWDPHTGRQVRRLEAEEYFKTDPFDACAIAPDGSFVVGARRHQLHLWDPTTGERIGSLGPHEHEVTSLAVAPDGSFIVSADWDRCLRVWDRASGVERARFVGHADRVTDCAVSPDGTYVASVGRDRTVRLWDPRTGVELCQLPTSAELSGVSIGGPGGAIVCCGAGGFLVVLDVIGLDG